MIHSCHRTAASRNSKVSRSELRAARRGTADVRSAFARSWEMSSLNGGCALFSPPPLPSFPLLNSLPLNAHPFHALFRILPSHCVLSIRGNYEATDSSCLEEFRAAETTRSSTRGYIRLRRFLRSHSYPCGNDKTDGALLLKSHRVSRIRWNLWELSSRALSPSPSPFLVGGWFISNGLVSSGRRNVDATFWRTLSCIRRYTLLETPRRETLIVCN